MVANAPEGVLMTVLSPRSSVSFAPAATACSGTCGGRGMVNVFGPVRAPLAVAGVSPGPSPEDAHPTSPSIRRTRPVTLSSFFIALPLTRWDTDAGQLRFDVVRS